MKKPRALSVGAFFLLLTSSVFAEKIEEMPGGRLEAIGAGAKLLGSCPLKHTAVEAEISGMVARVSVTQEFHNPFKDRIEAVYVFPLHQDSAVDAMTMTIGDRVVKGIIKERGEAKRIYEEAKAEGKRSALLDQERPNIFTQAVANIGPGEAISITIRYSQTIDWIDGRFVFDLPTVVGPRYIPGNSLSQPVAAQGENEMPSFFSNRGQADDPPVVDPAATPPTDQVPDAHRITPPVIAEGHRAGHDLSIRVVLHAGSPILDLKSALHEIVMTHPEGDRSRAVVTLQNNSVIPNRDFVISYRTADEAITDSVLTHSGGQGKFFTLVLQPPARVKQEQIVPRELVFVLDTSGSMSGFPIETSKALMRRAIEELRPADSFNLITFAGTTAVFSSKPVANTEANRRRALRFLDTLQGGGGTEMMKAINIALGGEHDPKKVRIVCFLTDGFVGNDQEIVGAVKKHARTTRVFSFGIGASVNRFLMDEMARAGLGEALYVLTHGEAKKTADTFYGRIDAPVLTDIELDFGDLMVEDIYPKRVNDLFASKPVVVKGRYTAAGEGALILKGRNADGRFERRIPVSLPAENPENRVLASQWARAKVDDLMMKDMVGLQRGRTRPASQKEITALGITYGLLTQYTSLVAVEEREVTENGVPRTVYVPVEMPEGVSYLGAFGSDGGVSPSMTKGGKGGSGGGDGDFGAGWGSGGDGGGGGFGNIPSAMRKRCTKEDRLERLRTNGGTEECENAVGKTLDWLQKRQNEDGSWCEREKAAMTGFALLAYLGRCETPLSEKYGEGVTNAMLYLIDLANKNKGRLTDDPNATPWQYGHAIATSALAESYNYCRQLGLNIPGLEEAVRNAGQLIIDQQAKSGAWIGDPAGGDDLSLVCANLQALKACRLTGLDYRTLRACAKKALTFIEKCQQPNGSIGVPGTQVEGASLTGAAALSFQIWSLASHTLPDEAGRYLAKQSAFKWDAAGADLQALFFDVQAMLHLGGESWIAFNSAFLPEVLGAQKEDGSFKDLGGAAGQVGPQFPPFRGGDDVASHCRTCLAALTLEVYYRDLPSAKR